MKSLSFIRQACWLVIVYLLMPSAQLESQVLKASMKDLTNESTAVLYGKCTKKRCEWNEDKSIIYTYVTVAPEEYLKGNLGSEAVIAVPGGQVGDIIYEVSEMPLFTEGEEIVAFIWTNPAGKNLLTGGFQGKMNISKDVITGKRTVEGFSLGDETAAQHQAPGQNNKTKRMMLEDFVKKVKGYLNN